ncbi:hypothetical protein H4S02_007128, partial [Coemansia sp. RSA 2611]
RTWTLTTASMLSSKRSSTDRDWALPACRSTLSMTAMAYREQKRQRRLSKPLKRSSVARKR